MKLRKKSLISICIIALTIVLSVICFYLTKTNNLKMVAVKDNETRRSMTYNEVNDDSANIDNCEYVKFNSFFIKDLDGDGYAEKKRVSNQSTCSGFDHQHGCWPCCQCLCLYLSPKKIGDLFSGLLFLHIFSHFHQKIALKIFICILYPTYFLCILKELNR